ncbi:restriction endonuclease subunit S [Nannocystis sp. RBIL2]|uniref:restriction endonuclease subunit S n=1 Tax=Nannocystis sp. RBIL2 TaxID=2996788 RepID=UPI00226FC272|nr:restriction endonuclease subunit S [Nannocystis sp. RBIL2]MCY1068046.1 restriction endonuclease subunit S [Nannocystis sp. RBIL2]
MSDRPLVSLDTVARLVTEKTAGSKELTRPYVGLEHMKTDSPDLLGFGSAANSISINGIFEQGDTLFGKLRPNLRKTVLAPFPGYCSTDILILRPNAGYLPGFVARLFQSGNVFSRAIQTSIGTKMPRTSWTSMRRLPVYAPSCDEQALISEFVDQLDEQVRKTEHLVAKLKLVKQGLLHDLLTRGIDDNGELRGLDRHPEQFKDSPLGCIPKSWETPLLGTVAKIRSGTTPSRDIGQFWSRGSIPWVKTAEICFAPIYTTEEKVTEIALHSTSLDLFPPTTVLIAMYGQGATRGRCGILQISATINQACAAIQGNPQIVDQNFLFQLLCAKYEHLRGLGHGSQQTNLSSSLLTQVRLPFPPLAEQRVINSVVSQVDSRIETETGSAAKLRLLKQALMDDLLTGRVRVTPLLEGNF